MPSPYTPFGSFARGNGLASGSTQTSGANLNRAPPVGVIPEPAAGSTAERITRHKDYYLSSGDVHFLVENYLFRVHRYFFERESIIFREKVSFSTISGLPVGSSQDTAIPLDDVRAEDFAKFLWIFYNPKHSIYDASTDDWSVILRLAFDWWFPEIKNLCCRELEKLTIDPIKKIDLYQRYDVDRRLLIPSYAALTMRPQALSLTEGRTLGLETSLLLAEAREAARNIGGPPTNTNRDRVKEIIVRIFNLGGSPTTLEPVRELHNFGPSQPSRQVPVTLQEQPQPANGHTTEPHLTSQSSPPPSDNLDQDPSQTQPENDPANSASDPPRGETNQEQGAGESTGGTGASGAERPTSRAGNNSIFGDVDQKNEGAANETRPISPAATRRGRGTGLGRNR